MTSRERIIAAFEGKKPDHIPLAIYPWFLETEPYVNYRKEWDELIHRGLGILSQCSTFIPKRPDVEEIMQQETWNGQYAERIILKTPVGEVSQLSINRWVQEYYLKTPEDYRVMEYYIRNTRYEYNTGAFEKSEEETGDKGVTIVYPELRSPMQSILVDLVGQENFAYHLAEGFPELYVLQEALTDKLVENCRMIADGPGRYVDLMENFTSEMWGPERFKKYHMPVYEKIVPILHARGKKLFAHFDGKVACISELIAQTGIDGMESLTTPPEGNMTYEEARRSWPEKVFLANINLSHYSLPPEQLKQKVRELVRQAAPDGRNLMFEISEDIPANWQVAIPIVLDTLGEID